MVNQYSCACAAGYIGEHCEMGKTIFTVVIMLRNELFKKLKNVTLPHVRTEQCAMKCLTSTVVYVLLATSENTAKPVRCFLQR